MEKIIDKDKCCGCTACMNICPKHAISMVEDKEGFKHPVIDQDKCIDCGLCKKTCPVLNTNNKESKNKCFVAYNKDEVSCKNKASSGSIFELIAKLILNENGIVIGAAFDENNKLNHIAIDNIKDLDKLKGSKYLQSHLNNIFTYIKENIKNKKILFVGTPCQVAGLKSFIKNDFNNLICLDLVCHGVPSPKLFEKYIKEIEDKYNSQIVDYNFRDKKTGWDTYSNTITFKNQKEITQLQKDNKYMKLFLSDIALRESCYNCNFKLGNKYSDITLGDFWGVNNYYPDMYNKTGVSAIIINTEKGNNMFNNIKDNIIYKECKLEEITNGNPSLKISGKYPKKRKEFFEKLGNKSVEELSKKYSRKNNIYMKVLNKIKKIMRL